MATLLNEAGGESVVRATRFVRQWRYYNGFFKKQWKQNLIFVTRKALKV